ncbi:PP2C family protein-serine/threonine phosphatase [Streptomyces sp. NPDC096351]|uniref:PP2C family protein-serine/threonine phosphatase n=1 Tax=Streptomyces sp. NPDC096351 TaxID=3366087 RepID=UPI00382F3F46
MEIAATQPSPLPGQAGEVSRWLRHVAQEGRLVALDCGTQEAAALTGTGYAAFAGVPLYGEGGALLGVLAAFDTGVRSWSPQNVQDLSDLAETCAAELALRSSAARAHDARRGAEQAQYDAEAATGRAHDGAQALKGRLDRSELMLRAAELLGNTSGLDEVRRTVSELVSGDLKPAYVGLTLREDDEVLRRAVDAASGPAELEKQLPRYALSDDWPSAQAARENRVVLVPDRQTLVDGYDPRTVAVFDAMGLHTAICVPLPGTRRATLGTLVVAWDEPHEIDLHERAVLTAIAGYTALAVQRAAHLDERITVARRLQQAMLTDLPKVGGLEIAALYRPAAERDMVGGDWYDAYPLPGDGRADSHCGPLAVTVGDITGHDMHAAALMGQARSMLRQADIERKDSPAAAVASLEHANKHLNTGISGTLVHAHLTPRPHSRWLLTWVNAGHPPPLLAHPRQGVEQLEEHSLLMHPAVTPNGGRPLYERTLRPGSLLLLYTDGLIDHRGRSLDQTLDHARRILAEAADDNTSLPRLLDLLADTLAGPEHDDDIVLLALRVTDEE